MVEQIDFDCDYSSDERLFHYTNSEGLVGILQSNCLWATHFQFLNDSKEFYAARASLEEFARSTIHARIAARKVNENLEVKEGVSLREKARQISREIVSVMYEALLGDHAGVCSPYVFSAFCCSPAKADQFNDGGLLHWATYGRNGGYAIQINPHVLYKLTCADSPFNYLSRRAVYTTGGVVPNELKGDYEELASVFKSMFDGDSIELKQLVPATAPFARIVSVLKDAYFEQEHEARIVVMRPHRVAEGRRDFEVYLRSTPTYTIPYIKLFEGNLLGCEKAIERIVVGPHKDNARRVVALKTYLRARSLDIEVTESSVPYLSLSS